jgi:aspartate dehydrogenase
MTDMRKNKLKIGIIGCGAIGTELAALLKSRFANRVSFAAFCDLEASRSQGLARRVKQGVATSLSRVIDLSDLIVEAASASVSALIAEAALRRGKDVLVMSVGGLLGHERSLMSLASRSQGRLLIPSGAIAGLDAVGALAWVGIESITLKTYKPPKALEGASGLRELGVSLKGLKKEKTVFSGTAHEAVRLFPQNINVVAALSLAARGQVVPRVRIIAVPGLTRNVHEIEVVSKAARVTVRCENVPSPENPKTSYLAVLAAAAVVGRRLDPVSVGS